MNRWSTGPDPIPPLGGNAHVWAVELDDSGFDGFKWHGRISPEEQARAVRFKFDKDQRRYIIAHAALRDVLAAYTNAEAASLQFNDGPNGKPKLAPPFDASGIEFNLSHSHELALVAVNQTGEVGVDIEFAKPDFDFLEVANRFFTKREVAALRALPSEFQSQAFYKCWTGKEAFLKAKGTGLSGELDEVKITLSGEHVQIKANVAGWSLAELDPPEGYEAALVTECRPMEISCFRWKAAW
ncbi:MAG TPA: 4'-phosphopantetheinyl transferase superfamily protein [Candidatus Binatia bacterium]|nr:4'-phosphopantetheinyl transferase superfamily protein [Candidatus Binatia bacterium]